MPAKRKTGTLGELWVASVLPEDIAASRPILDKKGVAEVLSLVAKKYPDKYKDISYKLNRIGAEASYTSGGNSFGLEDMRKSLRAKHRQMQFQKKFEEVLNDDTLDDEARNKKIIELTAELNKGLADEVFEESFAEQNPLAFQILGAGRGNKNSLASLRAGDGLYEDHRNNIIPIPVTKSYSQGLSPLQYWASTYGARQGVLATKFCLAIGTKVLMSDFSYKAIEDIVVGDKVFTLDENDRLVETTVTNTFNNGYRLCNKYEFRLGKSKETISVVATPDHKILLEYRARSGELRRKMVRLQEATRGRKSAVVAKGHNGAIAEPRAGILGALLGDGGLTTQNTNVYATDSLFIAALQKEAEVVNLQPVLSYENPDGADRYALQEIIKSSGIGSGHKTPFRTWLEDLALLGLAAPQKFVPQSAWSWDEPSCKRLAAFLLETDGCATQVTNNFGKKYPAVSFEVTSEPLAHSFKQFLQDKLGIYSSNISEAAVSGRSTEINGRVVVHRHNLYKFQITSRDDLERLATFWKGTGAKSDKFQQLMQEFSCVNKPTLPSRFVRYSVVGLLPTFDIEVDHPTHRFVLANGLVVSNSVQDAGAFSKQLNQITHRLLVTADDRDKEPDAPIGLPVDTEDDDSVGSLLAYPVAGYKRNTIITPKILADIRKRGITEILVRSPAVSGAPDGGLYAKDAGIREFGNFPVLGENIGLVASQSLGEPLSQSQLCLAVDTSVRMADFTIKRLGDIQPGEWVLGADKHGNLFPVRVKARYDNGVRKCIRYVFRTEEQDYLEFVSTDDHKFLVKFNGAEDVVPVREAAASDSFCLQAAVDGKLVSCQFFALELVGEVETCDIEVEHPDHLFVLANGLITSNSAKHSGGVAGQVRSLSGFDLLNELVQIPKKFKDSAAHAEVDGRVRSIEKAPAGGYYVYIGDNRHYVPLGFKPLVQVGQSVEAGDVLSEGVPNPAMITKYKGIGEGRRYFIKTMKQAMEDSGIKAHRRNIEILARGLINHIRFKDETDDYVQDDIVPYSMFEHTYTPREGFKSLSPLQAAGKYLERPYLHYEIGTKVKPSVIKMLNRYNINKIDVHDDEPIFEPVMVRGMANLHYDPDWMTQMYGSGLKSSLLESVHRGRASDRHGTSFVPSRARAVDFGREGKIISPKRSVLSKKQWPDLMDAEQ